MLLEDIRKDVEFLIENLHRKNNNNFSITKFKIIILFTHVFNFRGQLLKPIVFHISIANLLLILTIFLP